MTAPGGRYLYAVVENTGECDLGPIGMDGGRVYTIAEGAVAAVVSDVPNRKVRPERRKLAAHHQVLRELMARPALLPMAFGLIADGPEDVRGILARGQEGFVGQLRRVRGCVEMGLRVSWAVPNIFEYFLRSHAELREMRDELFAGGADPGPDAKMELGRLFDRALTDRRRDDAEVVVQALRPACVEVKENKPKSEREIMNLACLIRAESAAAFEAAVAAAAGRFGDEYTLDLSGPWPPHNFVESAVDV